MDVKHGNDLHVDSVRGLIHPSLPLFDGPSILTPYVHMLWRMARSGENMHEELADVSFDPGKGSPVLRQCLSCTIPMAIPIA